MIDIQVKNLTKFFVIGENLLEDLSFDIQEGERVAILGRNGCGKTTLFNILTGQMDYDAGEVYVNPHKRLGLISQIPKFPVGYTVEDVLRTAFQVLTKTRERMTLLEQAMSAGATSEQLREYDTLVNRFQAGGGYEMDVEVDKICNGLGISQDQRVQDFASLSGGEKTRVNLARLLLEKTTALRVRCLLSPTTVISWTPLPSASLRSQTVTRNSTPVTIHSIWMKNRPGLTCN